MVETAYRTLKTYQQNGMHGIEPLSLPAAQILKRPAFTVTADSMLWALIVPNRELRSSMQQEV
jgi:hypothetical protein